MDENNIVGKLYDIQGFSVQDGPGIRTTAFLKGCPLRCPWCHSPESQQFYPQLSWIDMRCQGTELCEERCMKACPKNAIEYGKTGKNRQMTHPCGYSAREPRRVGCPRAANPVKSVFRRDMCVAKNSSRSAYCASEASAGSRPQPFSKKSVDFFETQYPRKAAAFRG